MTRRRADPVFGPMTPDQFTGPLAVFEGKKKANAYKSWSAA